VAGGTAVLAGGGAAGAASVGLADGCGVNSDRGVCERASWWPSTSPDWSVAWVAVPQAVAPNARMARAPRSRREVMARRLIGTSASSSAEVVPS
jgi:hypothetical protein